MSFHYTTTREITAIWLLSTALFQLKFEIIGIYSLDDGTTTKLNMVKLVKNRDYSAHDFYLLGSFTLLSPIMEIKTQIFQNLIFSIQVKYH